ncbi:hypothetical protein GCM10011344_13900 [Dokdonia pacifica]|uniref:Uncharacterized protein n=1 Tax=Dokdonia pacifica TaxID=1627892 RepID=A0A238W7D4_9FLAO|nr:hypothetical protein GCM10011344_13900 [Dokdonia pacifica]SNR42321.1 hypothetical protein SAMN06265376_101758 [Dokdonia pacifica]
MCTYDIILFKVVNTTVCKLFINGKKFGIFYTECLSPRVLYLSIKNWFSKLVDQFLILKYIDNFDTHNNLGIFYILIIRLCTIALMKKEVIIGKGKTMGVQILIMPLKSRLRIIGWFDV